MRMEIPSRICFRRSDDRGRIASGVSIVRFGRRGGTDVTAFEVDKTIGCLAVVMPS